MPGAKSVTQFQGDWKHTIMFIILIFCFNLKVTQSNWLIHILIIVWDILQLDDSFKWPMISAVEIL